MYNPKVSIIIPVYNGANYLSEAIDSALSQTYNNIEIIVVNDGSNDDGATDSIAKTYGDKIKYFTKENGGVSSALNLGIKHSDGEWISWLSHDDLYTPNKIEIQVNDVKNAKKSGQDYKHVLYYCVGGCMDASGKHISRKRKILDPGFYSGYDTLMNLFKGYGIGGCGLLIPKNMFEEIGGFDEDMRYMQDVFMWEKAFIAGYSFFVNQKISSLTRIHSLQVSTTGKAYALKDRETVGLYLSKHLEGICDSKGNSILKYYMFLCLKSNNLHTAYMLFKKLKKRQEIRHFDYLYFYTYKTYGFFREKLKKIYYLIKFNTKR